MSRETPFDLVFGAMAEERFPSLAASLAAAAIDPTDRDAFVLDRAVTELLRDLVPEDAPPESLHEFIAVLQHSYLFWDAGRRVIVADKAGKAGKAEISQLAQVPLTSALPALPAYVQLPSHLYWGQLDGDGPHEPLDGFFVHPLGEGIRALAIFGLHPERPGFTVSEVSGGGPVASMPRDDGSAPFAPLMEGGAAAGLRSVAGPGELLALAWHSLRSEA